MLDHKSHIPLYVQLANEIRRQILEGIIKPGEKLDSEVEMVRQYGVGRLTIRDALAVLVNEDLLKKEHGKGTFCKKSVVSSPSMNIDVFLNMSDNYFIPYYMQSINKVLNENNANFIVSNTQNSPNEICQLLRKVLDRGSSGIILQPSPFNEPPSSQLTDLFQQLRLAEIPYIMIDSYYEGIPASYAIMDERKAGELAAQHFINCGHRHLGAIHVHNYQDSQLRLKGFQDCLLANGLPHAQEVRYNALLKEHLEQLIFGNDPITGIFCYNDETAQSCINILKELRVQVPGQISIIGCDDTVLATAVEPKLTTIEHPKAILGEVATLALLERILHPSSPPFIKVFEPSLIVRDSCLSISVEDVG